MGQNKKTSLLLVEDNTILSKSTKLDLEKTGYAVTSASSSENALEAIKSNPDTDLILMDIDLGSGLDGIDTAEKILHHHNVPILFLSNHTEPEIIERVQKVRAYGFVLKNAPITILDTSIKMALKLYAHSATPTPSSVEQDLSLMQSSIQAATDALFWMTSDSRIVQVNKAACKLLGYTEEELLQLRVPDVDIYYNEEVWKKHFPDLREKGSLTFPSTHRAKDGRLIPVEIVANYIQYKNREYNCAFVRDITERQHIEEQLNHKISDMQFLSETALEFINLDTDSDIFELIGAKLEYMLPGYRILVSEFNNSKQTTTIRALIGGEDIMAQTIKILGKNVIGMSTHMPERDRNSMLNKGLITFAGGVEEITAGSIPKIVCALLDKLLNFEKIYGMGFSSDNKIYGNIVLFSPKGVLLENQTVIEAFVKQAAVAIQKYKAEKKIKKLLDEKTVLLSEVHHRIKNNIASIKSLLSLQVKTTQNPEALSILQDVLGRIKGMHVLYEKLMVSEKYDTLNVKHFIEELVEAIIVVFPDHHKIEIIKDIKNFDLSTKELFPLGIIINELFTNVIKYAFKDKKRRVIKISLSKQKNTVTLVMQDNGVGLPKGFDSGQSKGLGLLVVEMLCEQLDGSFTIESNKGTKSTITFNV